MQPHHPVLRPNKFGNTEETEGGKGKETGNGRRTEEENEGGKREGLLL